MTTAAACVVTGGVAALVFVFSRDVIAAWVARVGLALIVVLTPLAGMEILGNVANVHWYLLYLTPWLLLATPRSRVGSVLMVLLALAVTLTEPQAILFVPLAVWRFLKVPAVRPVVYGYAAGLAAQVLSTLLAGRSRTGGLPPPLSVAEGYWANAALSVFTGNGQWTGWLILPYRLVGDPGRGAGVHAVRSVRVRVRPAHRAADGADSGARFAGDLVLVIHLQQ